MAERKAPKAPAKKAGATKKTVAKKAGATKKTVAKKAGAKRAAPKKNPAAGAVRNIMYTCRSCVWTEAQREIDGKRQGTFLLEAINELADKNPLPASIDMRGVFCLNGCLNPCNVSFRARDKYSLRFSRLTPDHAADIVAVAEAYAASGDGNLSDEEIPAELRDKVSVRTPPPPSSRP